MFGQLSDPFWFDWLWFDWLWFELEPEPELVEEPEEEDEELPLAAFAIAAPPPATTPTAAIVASPMPNRLMTITSFRISLTPTSQPARPKTTLTTL
jgi:hypothetical protein